MKSKRIANGAHVQVASASQQTDFVFMWLGNRPSSYIMSMLTIVIAPLGIRVPSDRVIGISATRCIAA